MERAEDSSGTGVRSTDWRTGEELDTTTGGVLVEDVEPEDDLTLLLALVFPRFRFPLI